MSMVNELRHQKKIPFAKLDITDLRTPQECASQLQKIKERILAQRESLKKLSTAEPTVKERVEKLKGEVLECANMAIELFEGIERESQWTQELRKALDRLRDRCNEIDLKIKKINRPK